MKSPFFILLDKALSVLKYWAKILRAIGVLWPSWVFVLILYIVFLGLDQGQDILRFTSERSSQLIFSGFGVLFASVVTWYSLRLVGFTFLCALIHPAKKVSVHTGRMSSYFVYTAIITGYLKVLGVIDSSTEIICVQVISMTMYFVTLTIGEKIKSFTTSKNAFWFWLLTWSVMIIGIFISALNPNSSFIMIGLIISQFGTMIHMTCRGAWTQNISFHKKVVDPVLSLYRSSWIGKLVRFIKDKFFEGLHDANRCCDLDTEPIFQKLKDDKWYFYIFNLISIITVVIFWYANNSVSFAIKAGPLVWVIIGLSGALGMINLLRSLGRTMRMGLFSVILIWAFTVGCFTDIHRVQQPDLCEFQGDINERHDFKTVLGHWYENFNPKMTDSLNTKETIPLIFVMGDGGALRSGYWASLIYRELEERSKNEFGKKVFSFSGASGGNTGNAVYYSLLHESDSAAWKACEILHKDIFSFTVARMFFNDVLSNFVPGGFPDRGAGLVEGLSHMTSESAVTTNLNHPFTSFVPEIDNSNWFPMLCMNTTRMQDAAPAVISTIDISGSEQLNHRVDVVDRIKKKTFISMSTMATLGSRFPYVSPGGGILVEPSLHDVPHGLHYEYFVDGGYMDNSGAGIVLEMIMSLHNLQDDLGLYQNVEPYVIHIQNTSKKDTLASRIHPILNDAAAPLLTLFGSYGAQTDVLTDRLQKYLQTTDHDNNYINLNLFEGWDEKLSYNWLMSDRTKGAMESRLEVQNENLDRIVDVLSKLKLGG